MYRYTNAGCQTRANYGYGLLLYRRADRQESCSFQKTIVFIFVIVQTKSVRLVRILRVPRTEVNVVNRSSSSQSFETLASSDTSKPTAGPLPVILCRLKTSFHPELQMLFCMKSLREVETTNSGARNLAGKQTVFGGDLTGCAFRSRPSTAFKKRKVGEARLLVCFCHCWEDQDEQYNVHQSWTFFS